MTKIKDKLMVVWIQTFCNIIFHLNLEKIDNYVCINWVNFSDDFLTWKSVNSSSTKGTWWWVRLVHSVFSLESMKLCKRLKMVLYIFKKVSLMSTNWDWWFKSWPSCSRVRIQIVLSVSCNSYPIIQLVYLRTHQESQNLKIRHIATQFDYLLLYWWVKVIRAMA